MMESEILFQEQQRVRQWWIWLTLLSVNAIFIFGTISQVIGGGQFGDNPMSDGQLLFATAGLLLVTILLLSFRLETTIKRDGIYVRLFPFHIKEKYFPWNSLTKAFVKSYAPLSQYGGWGLRFGIFAKGTAYNISGNQGLQLEFINDKRLLIGTRKAEELEATLKKIEQLKN